MTGTVTLSKRVGSGGATVSLSSSSSAATVPSSVTVGAGASKATFTIRTTAVALTTKAVIQAGLGGSSAKATLTITGPKLTSLVFSPNKVPGGLTTGGTVSLKGAAPAGGITVTLASTSKAWGGPSSVSIAAGAGSASFTAQTNPVSAQQTANVTAKISGSSANASLTVEPPQISQIQLNPQTVGGTATSTGTVDLSTAAPTGGLKVKLTSNSKTAQVPATLVVPEGSRTATFSVTTANVAAPTEAQITGKSGSSSASAALTIDPLGLESITLNPTTVTGGKQSEGTVALNAPAPETGLAVFLSGTAGVTLPSQVVIQAGATSASFSIATPSVSTLTSSTITASLGSVTQTATLTINALTVSDLTFNPGSVVGGTSLTGTVTVNGSAPTGGLIVNLSSSNAAAGVPGSVVVPSGATTASFTVTTQPVAQLTSPVITAATGGSSLGESFNVEPPSILSITLNPTTVTGGSSATGTVTLNGPAPSTGFTIGLSSNQSAVVVPATVTVSAAAKAAAFKVTTQPVSAQTVGTITGTDPAGKTASAQLTVNVQLELVLPITVQSMVYDPVSGNIWVATLSNDPTYPNYVVGVNPATGAIGPTINVGVDLQCIAVTDNGQYAYVGSPQDGSIRRVNLTSDTVDAIFADKISGMVDLETVPGSPLSYIVLTNPEFGVNTTVWDSGVVRPNTAPAGYDARFASDGVTLYGDGRGSLFVDTLTSQGLTWDSQPGLNASGFVCANDLLYTAVPNVIDPVQQVVVESFPTTDFLLSNVEVGVSTKDNRVYFVTWDASHNKRVLDFDMTSYQEYTYFDTGSLPGGAQNFIACDNHTVAFYVFGSGVTQNLIIVHALP